MRFIPTRIHGFLDYGMGLLLILAPWIFGFADGGPETWVPVILGIGAIGYSLFTDYELGMVRVLPMATHLMLDIASGLVLAVSPWILGFADDVWVPHVILGILEMGAGLMTRTTPETTRGRSGRAI